MGPCNNLFLLIAIFDLLGSRLFCADAKVLERREIDIVHPSPSTEVYVIGKNFNWADQDVNIYDFDGNVAYLVSNEDAEGHRFTRGSQFLLKSTHGEPSLVSDSAYGVCGFDHTYHATNDLKIKLSTQAFLPDKWYIDNAQLSGHRYVFNRKWDRISGDIVERKTGRVVAKISDKDTIQKPWVMEKIPSLELYSLTMTADGSIPACDLLALLLLAVTRAQHCRL